MPEDLVAEEARLARSAAAGDGEAFAELYRRYERRTYNLCLRILASEEDAADATQEAFLGVMRRLPKLTERELAFGSYLFTSARHACYDQVERSKRARPTDEIAEGATPVGGGVDGGGFGFDPGDPGDDPERNVLLAARQDEIRDANAQLPERQREVLVLRELEDLSYDEIAEIMDMNRNSVAQLISRARLGLRDGLRGTALASIASSSADCQRALALMAADQDGQPAGDASWLHSHMRVCDTCPLAREAMQEAGVSYRAWLPVAAAPLLLRETMAAAAEQTGHDWSEAIERATSGSRRGRLERLVTMGSSPGASGSARASMLRHRRRDLVLAGALAAAILLVALSTQLGDGTRTPDPEPVAEETPAAETTAAEPKPAAKRRKAGDKPAKRRRAAGGPAAAGEPSAAGKAAEPEQASEPGTTSGATGTDAGRRARQPARPGREGSTRVRGGSGGEGLNGTGSPTRPPADPPVATDPPVTDPPVDDPPPQDPPVSDPPVTDPPVTDPPVTDPPAGCTDANGRPVPCPPRRVPGTIRPPR